jgi:hypothetical protein
MQELQLITSQDFCQEIATGHNGMSSYWYEMMYVSVIHLLLSCYNLFVLILSDETAIDLSLQI